jgi:hypothetical protein
MKKTLFFTFAFYSIAAAILLLKFRNLRELFPPTQIGEYKIVGFAQYYGYPFYYDNLIFAALILLPSLIFILIYFLYKK